MRKKIQRGQVLVFYAFLLPIIFLFAGVGIDFGWYYLNVSRLQNAADAAVFAGAQSLIKNCSEFEDYYIVQLKDLPKNTLADYEDIDKDKLIESRTQVERYTSLNLSSNLDESGDTASDELTFTALDGWSVSADDKDRKVTGKVQLMQSLAEAHSGDKVSYYYWVDLSENIRHLFLPGWFAPMSAPVHSVVLLQPHEKDLYQAVTTLKNENTVLNWQYQKNHINASDNPNVYKGNWNHYKAGKNSKGNFNDNFGVRYISGNAYRTESVVVTTAFDTGSGDKTPANGGKFYSETEVDALNIDARAETRINFNKFGGLDWDIGQKLDGVAYNYNEEPGYSWDIGNGDDKRILLNVEFKDKFQTREDTDGKKKVSDPLWVGIESDPITDGINGMLEGNTSGAYNSVRQFIFNFNADNTATEGTGENKRYTWRPYFVFYTGPETINDGIGKNGQLVRYSRPVVINLNEDLNAIFYLPNSPAIINGNGHKLTGFVIARCFLKSLTVEDMTNNGKVTLYDGFNPTSIFKGDCIKGTDGNDNEVYVHKDDLLAEEKINEIYEEYDKPTDDSGNISVYKQLVPPKYILIDYTKADSQTYEIIEGGKHNENKTFAAYINDTYKEKFKKFSGLDDDKISAVTFPDENYNETTATYWVATSDLLDSDPDPNAAMADDTYVKVVVKIKNDEVMEDEAIKYVDKRKLPYAKVRVNKEAFFVCIYDLKFTDSGGKGLRMIDYTYSENAITDSFTQNGNITRTDADIYDPKTTIVNKYGDTWAVDRTWCNKQAANEPYKDWLSSKLQFGEENGVKYFMRKSEIIDEPQLIAKYHKINVDGEDMYVDEINKDYYTKVPSGSANYIIVDKNGNILTKPVTAPEIIPAFENFKTIYDDYMNKQKYDELLTEYDKLKNKYEGLQTAAERIFGLASQADFRNYWREYTRAMKDPEEIPMDNQYYRGRTTKNAYRAYRIPVFERVYKKSVFNLDDDSRYSYFQIPELKRVNYFYMNVNELRDDAQKVDDMFFTTIRAEWMD